MLDLTGGTIRANVTPELKLTTVHILFCVKDDNSLHLLLDYRILWLDFGHQGQSFKVLWHQSHLFLIYYYLASGTCGITTFISSAWYVAALNDHSCKVKKLHIYVGNFVIFLTANGLRPENRTVKDSTCQVDLLEYTIVKEILKSGSWLTRE